MLWAAVLRAQTLVPTPELGTVPGAEAGREARKTCPCVEDAYTETCRFSTGHKRDHGGEGTPNSTRSEV